MEAKKYIVPILLFLIIGLLITIVCLVSVGLSYTSQIETQEKQLEGLTRNTNENGLNACHYILTDPSVRNTSAKPPRAGFIIKGYNRLEQTGNCSLILKDDGTFNVTRSGSYSIVARVTIQDEKKHAAVGIYIDNMACDKHMQPIFHYNDSDSEKPYTTVVALKVECMDKKLDKGQVITIRLYNEMAIQHGQEAEAENWVHIKEAI